MERNLENVSEDGLAGAYVLSANQRDTAEELEEHQPEDGTFAVPSGYDSGAAGSSAGSSKK